MRVWLLGVLVLLALGAGAAAGWTWAESRVEGPTRTGTPLPVPAASPAYPAGAVEVLPDGTAPALATGLRYRPVTLGEKGLGVTVRAPRGWSTTHPSPVEWRFLPPDFTESSYFLRVRLVSGQFLTVEQALEQRLSALESVVFDLDLEELSDDTFRVSYTTDGYRRVAVERFLDLGEPFAYVSLAVVGRTADAPSLEELVDQAGLLARRS